MTRVMMAWIWYLDSVRGGEEEEDTVRSKSQIP